MARNLTARVGQVVNRGRTPGIKRHRVPLQSSQQQKLIVRRSMSDTRIVTLALLPLTLGVVLPQMVVPLAVEAPEAQAAADAAAASEGRLVLVPKLEGEGDRRFASVGTVAHIQE